MNARDPDATLVPGDPLVGLLAELREVKAALVETNELLLATRADSKIVRLAILGCEAQTLALAERVTRIEQHVFQ